MNCALPTALIMIALSTGALAAPGSLGVGLTDTPPGAPAHALIGMVQPGSAADKAGLRRGDVVESVDNQSVSGATELQSFVMSQQAGDALNFIVLRQGLEGPMTLHITATLAPRGNTAAAPPPSSSLSSSSAAATGVGDHWIKPAGNDTSEPLNLKLAGSIAWTRFQDPYERAFAIDAPKGWTTQGGLIRLSPVTINPVLRMIAPDRSSMIVMGDADLAYFAVPNQVSQMAGTREGTRYVSAGGQINVLMHYLNGEQFAETEGKKLFGQMCAHVALQSSHARPDFLPPRQSSSVPVRPEAGEARFTCDRGGHPLVGYLVAETDLIGQAPNFGWTVNQLWGFLSVPSLEPVSMAMVVHAAKSLAFSPAWTAHENQLAAQNVQAAEQSFADSERARAATNARIATYDRQFNAADDVVTGTGHFVDPETGAKYDVTTPNEHAWVGPNGKIVSTETSAPPPGMTPGWRQLDQLPAQ